MTSRLKVLRRVGVLGVVTASDLPTDQAQPQVFPRVIRCETLPTTLSAGCHVLNQTDVRALSLTSHNVTLSPVIRYQ